MLSFIGIGAQKAGTTWLYAMLKQHPDISFPHGKEVHFWDQIYDGSNENSYFKQFTVPDMIEGEITPSYGHLPKQTIREIYNNKPDLKLIYIIRNPIDRAWSSALMALKRAEMDFHEASDQWFIDHFHSQGSLHRGDYELSLKNWTDIFPKEQLLLLLHENIASRPAYILQEVCTHLKIEDFSEEKLHSMQIGKKVFPNAPQKINQHLMSELQNIYHPKIYSLEKYLNIDLKDWLAGT